MLNILKDHDSVKILVYDSIGDKLYFEVEQSYCGFEIFKYSEPMDFIHDDDPIKQLLMAMRIADENSSKLLMESTGETMEDALDKIVTEYRISGFIAGFFQ